MINKPKKILSIPAETFPTHEPFLGEVYSNENELFKTVFLMKSDKMFSKKTLWNKSQVYLINNEFKFKIMKYINTYFKIDLRYLYMIPYIVFKEKIDIIQIRDMTFPLALGLFFKFFFGKKVVYQKSHPHEYHKINIAKTNENKNKLPKLLYLTTLAENMILHKMMYCSDAVFPITHYMSKELNKNYHIPYKKMHPFGMGFNFNNIKDLCQDHDLDHSTFRFLYIGTLAKERNFDALLFGISKYFKTYKNHDVSFDFIGGKKDEIDTLKKLGQSLKIDKFLNFQGRLERYQVYKLIPQYHIGISWFGTSKRFNCASPTKLMEYLSFGLPFLATDSVIMHHDIQAATSAGVITKISPDDICEKINECIVDYPFLAEKANNVPDYIMQNHNYSIMKKKVLSIYNKL